MQKQLHGSVTQLPKLAKVDKQALLDVVRKIDFDAGDLSPNRFAESFDRLREVFTPDEISSGKL